MGKITFLYICIWALSLSTALGQIPLITVYEPETYNASQRNWGVAQDSLDFIYVANDDGILKYTGSQWELITVPGRQARSITADRDGIIYTGTANNFGYIARGQNGKPEYRSLSDSLPDEQQPIWVFNTHAIGKTVYFMTQYAVYTYHPNQGVQYFPQDETLITGSVVREVFYFQDYFHIYRLINNEVHKVRSIRDGFPGTDQIYDIMPYRGDEYLVFTREGNFYYTEGGLRGRFHPWKTELADLNYTFRFYLTFDYTDELKDLYGSRVYVVQDMNTGLYFVNEAGEKLFTLYTDIHLPNNGAESIYFDSEHNLWIATLRDIRKVTTSLPLRQFDSSFGLNTNVNDLLYKDDKLYAATNFGLYVQSEPGGTFQVIEGTQSQVWKLLTDGDYIIAAGGNRGVFLVKDDELTDRISWSKSSMTIAASPTQPGAFHIGKWNGYKMIRRDGDRLQEIDNTPEINVVIRSLAEDENGRVWLGTPLQGLYSYQLESLNPVSHSEVTRYGTDSGLIPPEHNHVFQGPHDILFTSRNHIYRFIEETNTFEPLAPDDWFNSRNPYPSFQFLNNEIWILSDKRKLTITGEGVREDDKSFNAINPDIRKVLSIRGNYYLATANGLFVQPHWFSAAQNMKPVYITRISAPEADIDVFMPDAHSPNPVTVPFHHSEISVSFAMPEFTQENNISYRFKMEGLSDTWSPWRDNTSAFFSGLPNGSFQFQVQARDMFGQLSEVQQLAIIVETPFFKSTMAYFIYTLLFFLFVYGAFKANNYRLIKRNEYLESLVVNRTDEILKQNQELIEANKTKSRFLSIAAHDMRNPLGIIQGYADLISESADNNKEISELALHIQSISDKMLAMINELLTPSNGESKHLPISNEEVNLRPILSQLITYNRVLANRKEQQILTELQETCVVFGDRGRLYEVFDNIINNAIKYSPPGSIILIQLRNSWEKGMPVKVQFVVCDQGPGIPAEQRNSIFEDYKTSENKTTGGEKSSGLGLGIVKQLIEIHNGKVWVEDNPDHHSGSRFVIELPCYRRPAIKTPQGL